MKQSIASENNFVIWKFMQKIWMNFNKHFQEVRRFEEKMYYE